MNEKNAPHKLCMEVLGRLSKAGVLSDLMVIGSWCVYFYQDYFGEKASLSPLRTRDIDFLIESPSRVRHSVNVPDLMEDLGFIRDIYDEGYIRLIHPELLIDFLVPRHGSASARPVPVKALGLNAQSLRFMEVLLNRKIYVKAKGLTLCLPHPANFALHKLLVSGRRRDAAKQAKDRQQAFEVLDAAIEHGDEAIMRQVYSELSKKQRSAILRELNRAQRHYSFHS